MVLIVFETRLIIAFMCNHIDVGTDFMALVRP